MRAMRPDGKDELEQELVSGQVLAVMRATELAADLAEFAWPVGEQQGAAGVAGRWEDFLAVDFASLRSLRY